MSRCSRLIPASALALALASTALGPALAHANAGRPLQQVRSHFQVASDVSQMVTDPAAQKLAGGRGMNIVNVMWEDTGRYLGSSVGPNISDVTIEVEAENRGGKRRFLMPVMRFPNFTDKTGDVDIDKFFLRVGNHEQGGALETITLRQLLEQPARYLSDARAGRIKGGTLLARRDEVVLTSAQAAFLPIRKGGKTRFWPVIFNYQSYAKNPAVLTILVTRQGTSMTIIDNSRDSVGSWGQRLYFNAGGERAPLLAEREKDVKASGVTANGEAAASLGDDANLMMLIQVPLVVKRRPRRAYAPEGAAAPMATGAGGAPAEKSRRGGVDIDQAVIGHGPTEGPYRELDGLTIERDTRFPVRVTVQFYQATSNGVIDRASVARMAKKIDRVYQQADYVGSLVVPGGMSRPTMWTGISAAPLGLSWTDFPGLVAYYGVRGWRGAWKHARNAYDEQPKLAY